MLRNFMVLVVFGFVVGIFYLRRNTKRIRALEEQALPYTPEEPPPPGRYLSRFTPEQQNFLRPLLKTAKGYFWGIFGTSFLIALIFASGANTFKATGGDYWPDPSGFAWFLFLFCSVLILRTIAVMMPIMAVTDFSMQLANGTYAQFPCTRPVSRMFQFNARVAALFFPILAAFILGFSINLGICYLLHGPIPNYGSDLTALAQSGDRHANYVYDDMTALQAASPLRLGLSFCITFSWLSLFSIAGCFLRLPLSRTTSNWTRLFPVSLPVFAWFALIISDIFRRHRANHLADAAFAYLNLESPPPYHDLIYPLLACVVLYFVARRLNANFQLF